MKVFDEVIMACFSPKCREKNDGKATVFGVGEKKVFVTLNLTTDTMTYEAMCPECKMMVQATRRV